MKKSKFAFTLAEVLITLGIIGVVAALTMPVLMAQHRKTVVETRLKKFYSTINQAITRAEVDYGDKKGWTAPNTETFWNTYLKPYLQYTKTEDLDKGTEDATEIIKLVYLPDGSAFVLNIYSAGNAGEIDFIPEAKNFNEELLGNFGSKSFRFGYWPDEEDERFVMHKNKGIEPYMANWNGVNPEQLKNDGLGCNTEGNGSFCTVIIARNGWKIPDDYPKKL